MKQLQWPEAEVDLEALLFILEWAKGEDIQPTEIRVNKWDYSRVRRGAQGRGVRWSEESWSLRFKEGKMALLEGVQITLLPRVEENVVEVWRGKERVAVFNFVPPKKRGLLQGSGLQDVTFQGDLWGEP